MFIRQLIFNRFFFSLPLSISQLPISLSLSTSVSFLLHLPNCFLPSPFLHCLHIYCTTTTLVSSLSHGWCDMPWRQSPRRLSLTIKANHPRQSSHLDMPSWLSRPLCGLWFAFGPLTTFHIFLIDHGPLFLLRNWFASGEFVSRLLSSYNYISNGDLIV